MANALLIELDERFQKNTLRDFHRSSVNSGYGGLVVALVKNFPVLLIAIAYGPDTTFGDASQAADDVFPSRYKERIGSLSLRGFECTTSDLLCAFDGCDGGWELGTSRRGTQIFIEMLWGRVSSTH